jgi:hypothetical protein
MADPNDADFIDNLQKLLGIDPKQFETLIPKLNPDILPDLAGAVTNSDKVLAMKLIMYGREHKMSEDKLLPKTKTKAKTILTDEDHILDHIGDFVEYNVGDEVYLDGKKVTIKVPNGPGNTVGVMKGGYLEMVERNKLGKRVEEGVLGMAAIPGIRRMQELAGIIGAGSECEDHGAEDVSDVIDVPSVEVRTIPNESEDCPMADASGAEALALLDQLTAMLPNLRLADISEIRKRIVTIQTKMNESQSVPGMRKRKI